MTSEEERTQSCALRRVCSPAWIYDRRSCRNLRVVIRSAAPCGTRNIFRNCFSRVAFRTEKLKIAQTEEAQAVAVIGRRIRKRNDVIQVQPFRAAPFAFEAALRAC